MKLLLACAIACFAASTGAQEASEMQRLRSEVELLQTKLQLAQKEIELLTNKLEKLSADNGELKNGVARGNAPDQPNSDLFAEGSIWKGEAKRAGQPDKMAHWVLTIAERKGGSFKGEIVIRPPDGQLVTMAVDGRAPVSDRGLVEFKTERKAFGQLALRGTLRDRQVGLVFVGTNPFGEPGAGAATLRRVDE